MTEPRARVRTKGQVFSTSDLNDLLYSYGDNTRTPTTSTSLPSTVAVLDEILTDFIIETCHGAALSASYSRRQKIKVDDFKWVLRKDERLLGRVLEQLWRERKMKDERRIMDFEKVEGGGMAGLEEIAEAGGAAQDMKVKKRRRRKRNADGELESRSKRAAP